LAKNKTYTVTGAASFHDHKPGESFKANLSPELEARAVARGSIVVGEVEEEQAKPLEELSRDELNSQAEQLGVNSPEKLGSKAEVIEAIRSYDKE
jgi:hypothetical protein